MLLDGCKAGTDMAEVLKDSSQVFLRGLQMRRQSKEFELAAVLRSKVRGMPFM